MHHQLEAYKPTAPARVHLLLAALMWTIVGSVLAVVGGHWLLGARIAYPGLWLILAAALGCLKARFVLLRTARRVVDRIRTRGDGRCIGGFVSWRTWAFIALMAGLGYVLRHGLLPHAVVGFIYVAVGVALLLAATSLWRAWHRFRPGA
jgi:hypothetical protein